MTSSFKVTIEQIDAVLPQTQCRECGYADCHAYAEALANNKTSIDRCPPGGINTLNALGKLLQVDTTSYEEDTVTNYRKPSVAVIDEDLCIGCVKCINACPVDAIVGAAKLMHTVIKNECSGCELCIPVCPMDCISMRSIAQRSHSEQQQRATQWRQRYTSRKARLAHQQQEQQQRYDRSKLNQKETARHLKQAAIQAAIARSKAKRAKFDE